MPPVPTQDPATTAGAAGEPTTLQNNTQLIGGQHAATAKEPSTPVEIAAQIMAQELEQAFDVLSMLEHKLSPILMSVPEDPNGKPLLNDSPGSSVVTSLISAYSDKIRNIRVRLAVLLERSEV